MKVRMRRLSWNYSHLPEDLQQRKLVTAVGTPTSPIWSRVLAPIASSYYFRYWHRNRYLHIAPVAKYSNRYSEYFGDTSSSWIGYYDAFKAASVERGQSAITGIEVRSNTALRSENLPPTALSVESEASSLLESLEAGNSLVFRFEQLPGSVQRSIPLVEQSKLLAEDVGADATVHTYIARQVGVKTLRPHSDPYDVLILQARGSKNWTICTPLLSSIFPNGHRGPGYRRFVSRSQTADA